MTAALETRDERHDIRHRPSHPRPSWRNGTRSKVGQRFVIDLELTLDLTAGSRSDKLADTVSYSAIVDTATEVFTRRNYRLIEAAGGAVADAILARFPKSMSSASPFASHMRPLRRSSVTPASS